MLNIKPLNFKVRSMRICRLDEFTFSVDSDRKVDLAVDASKVADDRVCIQLNLTVLIEKETVLNVHYAVEFAVRDPEQAEFVVTEDTLRLPFIQINAPAIAYPYLRAFVSTLCVNAGYDSVFLSTINFQALFEAKKKNGVTNSTILPPKKPPETILSSEP